MIVMILYHQTTIKPKYQAMLHVNATAQTCQIVSIDDIHRKSKSNIDAPDEAGAQILRGLGAISLHATCRIPQRRN